MYIICYQKPEYFHDVQCNIVNTWEIVSGEDAMQVRVTELMEELTCSPDDISVFDMETEIK